MHSCLAAPPAILNVFRNYWSFGMPLQTFCAIFGTCILIAVYSLSTGWRKLSLLSSQKMVCQCWQNVLFIIAPVYATLEIKMLICCSSSQYLWFKIFPCASSFPLSRTFSFVCFYLATVWVQTRSLCMCYHLQSFDIFMSPWT